MHVEQVPFKCRSRRCRGLTLTFPTLCSRTRQSVTHKPTKVSTAQAQEQPEAAHTVHDAAAVDAGAEVPSEAVPIDRGAG